MDRSGGSYQDRNDDSLYSDQGRRDNRRSSNNYSGDDRFGSRSNDSYGRQNDSYGRQNDSYGRQNDSYGRQNDSYGRQNDSYGRQNDSYGRQNDSYGRQNDSYGRQNNSYGRQNDSYSRSNDSYGRQNNYQNSRQDNNRAGDGDGRSRDSYNSPRGQNQYRSRNQSNLDNSYGNNNGDYNSRDRSSDYRSQSREQSQDRYDNRQSRDRRGGGRGGNRGGSRGGGGRGRGGGRDSYNDRGGSYNRFGDDEEEEQGETNSWKPILDNPEDAVELKGDLVTKILGKLREPQGLIVDSDTLSDETKVSVRNIPVKMEAYALQLLLGTCGTLAAFEQIDPKFLQAGVIATYVDVTSAHRAVRLLDNVQVKNSCLNVCPHCRTKTKKGIFNLELDWVTVTNDDASRKMIRQVIEENDLLPEVIGESQDGYGPWIAVPGNNDAELEAYEFVQMVYLGDQRARWFRQPYKFGVPMQRFVEKDNATLAEAINAVDEVITGDDDVLVMSTFVYDFVTFEKSSVLPENAPEIMTLKSDVNIDELIKMVDQANNKWATEYPQLKVIWLIPHPINFGHYNQILVSNAGLDIVLEDKLGSKHESDAKKLYSLILDFKSEWRAKLNNCYFIHMSELFFKKGIKVQTFLNDDKLSWPKNYTIDGLHPTEKMTRTLKNVLERWMAIMGLDPFTIAQSKDYQKPQTKIGVASKIINNETWKCGATAVGEEKMFYGHMDRLDALWTEDQDNGDGEEQPSKKVKTDASSGKETLSKSFDAVKANIMNILNVHSKM